MRKQYIMTPGPTPVPARVRAAEAKPIIHHRAPIYSSIFSDVLKDLKQIFQTKNDVIVFSSSGTGAMEAAVVNSFSPGDKVIATNNGKFGERFILLCETYGLDVIKIEYEWGQVIDPDDIKKALNENVDVKGVLVVHSETSTGVLNNIETISKFVNEYGCLMIVDTITGLGAVEVKTDDWNLDIVMSGSQKGLMLPPGLSCASISEKAWEAIEKSTIPNFYFSFAKARKSLQKASPQNPFTPPVSLIVALSEALKMMMEEGIDNIIKRHNILAEATRAGIEALGLELFAPSEGRGNAVTPVKVPDGIDGSDITKIMREKYGITIAGGQEHLKGKIFRIGHLGYFDRFDIITTLSGLEMTLQELDYEFELGQGIKAAENVFLDNPY